MLRNNALSSPSSSFRDTDGIHFQQERLQITTAFFDFASPSTIEAIMQQCRQRGITQVEIMQEGDEEEYIKSESSNTQAVSTCSLQTTYHSMQSTFIKLLENLCLLTSVRSFVMEDMNIDDNVILRISIVLSGKNIVEELNIAHNNISTIGMQNMLPTLRCITNLTVVNFSHNNIGDEGCCILATSLSRIKCLRILKVRGNNIGNKGAVAISESLQIASARQKRTANKKSNNNDTVDDDDDDDDNENDSPDGNTSATLQQSPAKLVLLDLAENLISDEGAISLANSLSYATSLRYLDLSSNKLTDESAKAFTKGVYFSASLITLLLNNNQITEVGAGYFVEYLTSVKRFRKQQQQEMFRKQNKLFTKSQDIVSSYSIELNELLSNANNNKYSMISIESNCFNSGISALIRRLSFPAKNPSILLAQRNCYCQNYHIEKQTYLVKSKRMQALQKTLSTTKLNFPKRKLQSFETAMLMSIQDAGLQLLTEYMDSTSADYFTTWKLANNNIHAAGLQYFADCLSKLKNLTHLDLSSNRLQDDGITVLSKALEITAHSSSICRLNLASNGINKAGALAFANFISVISNPNSKNQQSVDKKSASTHPLCFVDLSCNGIQDGGANILQALSHNKSLTTIDLNSNNLGNEFATSLCSLFASNTTLQNIVVGKNMIDAEQVLKIISCITPIKTSLNNNRDSNNNNNDNAPSPVIKRRKMKSLNVWLNNDYIAEYNCTLFDLLCKNNDMRAVKVLCSDLKFCDEEILERGLFLACKHKAEAVILFLIQVGVPLTTVEAPTGYTALHYAAKLNLVGCAQKLLDKGVDPLVVGVDGKTAEDLAQEHGNTTIVTILQHCFPLSNYWDYYAKESKTEPANSNPPTAPSTFAALVKFLLIGDSKVGKSSLLHELTAPTQYTRIESIQPTTCVDFKITTAIQSGVKMQFQIWDTAGDERYKAATTPYYKNVHVIVLMYDVTSQKSFNNVEKWITDISKVVDTQQYILFLIANKADITAKKKVTKLQGQQLAQRYNMKGFYQISCQQSSCNNITTKEIFIAMARYYLKQQKMIQKVPSSPTIDHSLRPQTTPVFSNIKATPTQFNSVTFGNSTNSRIFLEDFDFSRSEKDSYKVQGAENFMCEICDSRKLSCISYNVILSISSKFITFLPLLEMNGPIAISKDTNKTFVKCPVEPAVRIEIDTKSDTIFRLRWETPKFQVLLNSSKRSEIINSFYKQHIPHAIKQSNISSKFSLFWSIYNQRCQQQYLLPCTTIKQQCEQLDITEEACSEVTDSHLNLCEAFADKNHGFPFAAALRWNTSLSSVDFTLCHLGSYSQTATLSTASYFSTKNKNKNASSMQRQLIKQQQRIEKREAKRNKHNQTHSYHSKTAPQSPQFTRKTTLTPLGAICAAIAIHPTLKILNLSRNELTNEDAMEVASMISISNSLQSVSLRSNYFDDNGAGHIISSLKRNEALTWLDLADLSLTKDTARLFATAMQENNTLKSVDFTDNNLNDDAVPFFVDVMLSTTNSLQELCLARNPMNDVFIAKLGYKQNTEQSGDDTANKRSRPNDKTSTKSVTRMKTTLYRDNMHDIGESGLFKSKPRGSLDTSSSVVSSIVSSSSTSALFASEGSGTETASATHQELFSSVPNDIASCSQAVSRRASVNPAFISMQEATQDFEIHKEEDSNSHSYSDSTEFEKDAIL